MGPAHIRIVAVGHVKAPGYGMDQEEYAKRLQRYCRLEIVEVEDEPVRAACGRPYSGRLPGAGDGLPGGCPAGGGGAGPLSLERSGRQAVKLREGERLLRRLHRDCFQVALDSRGSRFTSEEFASWLGLQQASGRGAEIAFILGGTLGLSPVVLAQANLLLSLSSLTFPHQLARIILLEQLYRAFRILRQEPYHY